MLIDKKPNMKLEQVIHNYLTLNFKNVNLAGF